MRPAAASRGTRTPSPGTSSPRIPPAMPARGAEKVRDAERSREAILAPAGRLFAERGYDAASLQDIGAAAGLSRGTPSYFFGSKERLHLDVLRRAFDRRHEATTAAFAPVRAWCEDGGGGPDE